MPARGRGGGIRRGRLLPHRNGGARRRDQRVSLRQSEKPDKKIYLAVDLTADKMVIHVLDEGKGFKLEDVPNPLAEENLLSTSGRGIFLMRVVYG